jgi:leucyl/phenylalanyl-tRNA--protein transferase
MVRFPDGFKTSDSLKQTIRSQKFDVKFDHDFRQVIEMCAKVPRKGQQGTWITEEMMEAYTHMHELGFAHSVETYFDGELAGGLYGISLGKAFFGESMFFAKRDASKVALYHLVERLKAWDFRVIDAQQKTRHLKSLGARLISGVEFREILQSALREKTHRGKW